MKAKDSTAGDIRGLEHSLEGAGQERPREPGRIGGPYEMGPRLTGPCRSETEEGGRVGEQDMGWGSKQDRVRWMRELDSSFSNSSFIDQSLVQID